MRHVAKNIEGRTSANATINEQIASTTHETTRDWTTTGGKTMLGSRCWPRTYRSSCVTERVVRPFILAWLDHTIDLFFRTPRSAPHFTTQPRVQPLPDDMQWTLRRSSDRKRARVRITGGRTSHVSRINAERAWGSPWERAPRKLGGGVRNE